MLPTAVLFGGILLLLLLTTVVDATPSPLTENQIKEDIKFLSQSAPDGARPSRLRALLLADLRRALPELSADVNCTAQAELSLQPPRCTCAAYACPATAALTRSSNYGKRSSRIQRSCADFCCRRPASGSATAVAAALKSISIAAADTVVADQCEITKAEWYGDQHDLNNTSTANVPRLMPGIVQIFGSKSKQPLCLGTLVHPRVVMTTLVCATMQLNDRLRIRVRETVDRYQFRYQLRNVTRRLYPQNYAELFRQFGFNMGLLVLGGDPVQLNRQTRPVCWAKDAPNAKEMRRKGVRCYVDSLETKNGRLMERREEVLVYAQRHCQRRFREQGRGQMFFPKSSMCAGRADEGDIEIFQNGAPLHCVHETPTGFRYVQYGMLAWSAAINRAPHLFANVSNYRNWMERQLAEAVQQ